MKKAFKNLAALLLPTVKVMTGELKIYNEETLSLSVGQVYIVDDLKAGDDFSNTGFVAVGVPFLCINATPNNWSNGSYVLKQNLTLDQSFNDIDPNASVVKLSQNLFEIKITNGGFTAGKTTPIIVGGSFVKVVDSNTIVFNNQNGATYYKIEVIQ